MSNLPMDDLKARRPVALARDQLGRAPEVSFREGLRPPSIEQVPKRYQGGQPVAHAGHVTASWSNIPESQCSTSGWFVPGPWMRQGGHLNGH